MSPKTNTRKAVAEITDAGLFEQVAMAVLRLKYPAQLATASHSGVNFAGKTIKGAVDGHNIVIVNGRKTLTLAAHATGPAEGLEKKWFHDPSKLLRRTKKPGSGGAPPGDLLKMMKAVHAARSTIDSLDAHLLLTAASDPSLELQTKVAEFGAANDVEITVISGSAIAHVLDFDGPGQVIRAHFFHTPSTILSLELLQELGDRSMKDCQTVNSASDWIQRETPDFIEQGVVLVIGDSGVGKTVACLQALRSRHEAGLPVLVLRHEQVDNAVAFEDALNAELHRLCPTLPEGSGSSALALCDASSPLTVLVEDINRSNNPRATLNKIVSWSKRDEVRNWTLLCPIWPKWESEKDRNDGTKESLSLVRLKAFSETEARAALGRRAAAQAISLDDATATNLAEMLGNDPLLIGLFDFRNPSAAANTVLEEYVEAECKQVAHSSETVSAGRLIQALDWLGLSMLEHLSFTPQWQEVRKWSEAENHTAALTELTKKSTLVRLTDAGLTEAISWRHDRVLRHILAVAIGRELNKMDPWPDYLSDPYNAEALGLAIARSTVVPELASMAVEKNALSLFYALKELPDPDSSERKAVCAKLAEWLMDEEHQSTSSSTLRAYGLWLLAGIDGEDVLTLTNLLHHEKRNINYLMARYRNADVVAGLHLCHYVEIGVTYDAVTELHARVANKYRPGVIVELNKVIHNEELSAEATVMALRLAGYVGDPNLLPALSASWDRFGGESLLDNFLWAVARCTGKSTELLSKVVDAWEALPDTDEGHGVTKRNSLAADQVAWAFRAFPPSQVALRYLAARAPFGPLEWPIIYMLRTIDDPVVVETIAAYLGRKHHSSNGGISLRMSGLAEEWANAHPPRVMSEPSKKALESLWLANADKSMREMSFLLWASSINSGDLVLLSRIESTDDLYDLALFQRAIRRDLSVIPHLLPKLTGTHARYWWQTARYLWSAELTKALADAVARLAVLPTSGSEGSTDSDLGYSVLGEFLMERDAPTAETILMANRDKLQSRGVLVQAALYHATPALLNLAADVVRNQQNPRELFKHLTNHMGNRVQGRRGIFRIEQLNALIPYLSLLESSQILFLTELCARRGWRSFAERYLSTLQSHDMLRGRDVEALDKAYNETTRTMHQGWMYFGVERGFPLDELVEVGLDWLQRHLDLKGLTIICPSFASTARRKDVRRLIAMARHVPDSSDILSDTEFAVAVRSAE